MLYTDSGLMADLYLITMAQHYWQRQMTDHQAIFYLSCRDYPSEQRFMINCGLQHAIDFIQHWAFHPHDITYLKSLRNPDNTALFCDGFLEYLKQLRFTGHMSAIAEGTIIHPQEPILRISAPIIEAQLLETALINAYCHSINVASKAARLYLACQGDGFVEYGARRAQGPNGALQASRAAYIGGCRGTSNTLAGTTYDIPVYGTIAHSWILSYPCEQAAFEDTLKHWKNETILLIDTYDTKRAIEHVIKLAHKYSAQQNHTIKAIRIDSGDLLQLSHYARQQLDAANLTQIQIIASGDLDEYKIAQLKQAAAPIDLWGVGTKLVTAYDKPSLDISYKMTAIANAQGVLENRIKVSNTPQKMTLPGQLQVRRYYNKNTVRQDIIFDERQSIHDPMLDESHQTKDLLQDIFRNGTLVYHTPSIHDIRQHAITAIENFRDQDKPTIVSIDPQLLLQQQQLKNHAYDTL